MIYGKLNEMRDLTSVNPLLQKGIEYLRTTDLTSISAADGIIYLQGDDLFVLVMEYDTKDVNEKRFEYHDIYGEIQYVAEGEESMGITWRGLLDVDEDLLESADNLYYKNPEDCHLLPFYKDDLAVFFPEDVHLPGIKLNGAKSRVKKILVKFKT